MQWLQVYSLSVKLVAALSKASNRTFDKHSRTNIEIAPPPLPYPLASFFAHLNITNWLSYKSPILLGPENGCEGDWK